MSSVVIQLTEGAVLSKEFHIPNKDLQHHSLGQFDILSSILSLQLFFVDKIHTLAK